jgi:outer membrane protein assembly factor BamB
MRHRGSPDDAVVEVEIVEVTAHDDLTGALPEGTDEAPDEAALHPTLRRVLRWLGIAVIAGLALAVVTVNVAEARRDAARREAFADLPWVMSPMDGPLEEVWRAPGDWVLAETDEMIVAGSSTTDMALRGIDTATGEVVWERRDANEQCSPILDPVSQGTTIRYSPSRPEMLMCVPYDAFGSDGTPPAEGASVPVAFVDLDTGAVQGRVTVDGQLIGNAEAEGDVLLLSTRAEGAIGVVRVDPWSGDVAWTWTSRPGVLTDESYGDWFWDLDEDTGVLQIEGAETVAVSVESGAEVDAGPSVRDKSFAALLESPSGQVVEVSYDESSGGETWRVLEADGTTRFEVDGSWWWIWFDDGSVPDALMTQREDMAGAVMEGVSLTSVDIATGEERWSVLDGYSHPLFLLDGIAISTTGSSTFALDMRNGRWLWERPAASAMVPYYPMTDGEVVLVPVSDGQMELAALDLHTGEERWRMPAPAGLADARVAQDRTLLLITGSEVIAYR